MNIRLNNTALVYSYMATSASKPFGTEVTLTLGFPWGTAGDLGRNPIKLGSQYFDTLTAKGSFR